MPSTWRVQVIGEALGRAGVRAELDEYDVYALPPELRHRVLDSIVKQQAEFPMVLVNGEVACHSGIDLTAVLRAAWETMADDSCC